MESRAKLLGHAVHPILIVFPLGLLATAVVFDIVHMITGGAVYATVAFWMLAAGLIGGLLAAPFGLWDWLAIPSNTRAKSIGLIHALANGTALVLFFISWWIRYNAPDRPSTLAFVIALAGAVMALVGGWFGGELVERLGVGVDEGANLDAPSSLSHSTAHSTRAAANKS